MPQSAPQPIKPPFTEESARAKVQFAEDAWNSRDPERVVLAYTEDSDWRNRDEFITAARKSNRSSAANGQRNWITA
jgi:hypothetical protein